MKNQGSTAGAVSAGTGSGEGSATADARMTEFCKQLSSILVNAGRNRADCIVPKSGPVLSFGEWTERTIRSHPDVFAALTPPAAMGAQPSDSAEKDRTLIAALQDWASNCEGFPQTPSDARLMKALWTYEGDQTTPCPECDGECGEPCAPCTVAEAHARLDHFIAEYNKQHGIVQFPPEPEQEAGKATSPAE